jgi:hypothetical protein
MAGMPRQQRACHRNQSGFRRADANTLSCPLDTPSRILDGYLRAVTIQAADSIVIPSAVA